MSCTSLTNIKIPDSVEGIHERVFENCENLKSITLSENLTHLGQDAFYKCSNLTEIVCKAQNPPATRYIDKVGLDRPGGVFYGVNKQNCKLYVPKGCEEAYRASDLWKDFGNIVPITANVQHSGCLRETRDDAEEYKRAIILTKEGSVLTVQLLNYESNCGTTDFDVTHAMSWSSIGIPYSIYVTVKPICENEEDCICPYNVTFTIENVTDNSFRFVCWWYDGLVNLTDGKSLVLKEDVNINVEGLIYNLDDESFTAKLINGKTWEGELSIPSEIEWKGQKYVVNSIGQKAFEDCKGLTSISIPKSITTIGSNAFYGCTGLSTITIPKSVTTIGSNAFYGCTSLSTITIPDDITIIESGLFKDCVNLTSVIIPEGITTIGGEAFFGCKSLPSIMIPESVTSIGNNAFARCTSLTSFIIPNGVTSISQCTFSGCTNLTFVTIPNGVTSIGWAAFKECYSLTNISIPDGVTTIGDMAFAFSALTTIIIPNSVQSMGKSVFFSCKHLTSVVLSENLTSINQETFEDCISLTNINIPNGVTTIGYGAFYTCRNLPKITIPNSVTNIGSSAFSGCLGLLTLSIGKNVTHIGMSAFQNCTNLTDVYCYTDSVPIIENVAFTFNKRKPIASATLHVPVNSVDLYKADSRWNGFGNIVALEEETVSYTKDQMATIILPTEPDASKGKYYRLDRCEKGKIIFEEELSPKARTPYIIVPNEDFSIDLDKLELEGLYCDSTNIVGVSFIGTYNKKVFGYKDSFYYHILDSTPDCRDDVGKYLYVGPLRAFLEIDWRKNNHQNLEEMEVVLQDIPNDIVLHNHPKYYQDGDYWVQALVPWNFEGNTNDYETEGAGRNFSLYFFYVEGDTIIDNKEYKCVHTKTWKYDCEETYDHQPEGLVEGKQIPNVLFMREDADGRQWRRLATLSEEALLFDFSCPFEKGQKIRYCRHENLDDVLETLSYEVKAYSTPSHHRGIKAELSDEAPEGYYYYDLEISNVSSIDLPNGEQVPFANGRIAFGWGDVYQGDLFHQLSPLCEGSEGMFLYRVHQGQVILQNKNNVIKINDIIGKDVLSLFNKPMDADKYFPTGMKWKEVPAEPDYPLDTLYAVTWEIGPDTIINNLNYKQIIRDGKNINIWVRENAGKIWLMTEEYPRELLLYNFNWVPDEVLYTEYIRETDNGMEVFRDEFTVNDYKTTKCGNHTYQYIFNDEFATIRGIGRVSDLNKNSGLLGYRKMKEILPGLIYSKVLWINRNNEEIFRSEIAEEWTCEIPTNTNQNVPVSFTKNQMATIILPTTPDASNGKYYGLDRCEEGKIIFTEEREPKARTPYIIVPKEDFSIDLNTLDLDGLPRDTVSVKGASFIGSYCHEELSCQDGFYIDIIDATPDCQADDSNQRKAIVGALRACLIVSWDDPYNPGGSKGITEKRELVLKDNPNGIESLTPDPSPREKGTIYDLSGRKVNSQFSILNSQLKRKGLYIVNGKKIMVK